MVAFSKDIKRAAGLANIVQERYPLPSSYTMYFLDCMVSLLEVDDEQEFKRFFRMCGIDAHVLHVPKSEETKREEQGGD
jgi:hypothetical protein